MPTPNELADKLDGITTYRGWTIEPDYIGWSAVSPNYDVSWEGAEDGWVDNGECAWGRTREERIAGIDEWFDEHDSPQEQEA